MKSIHKHPKTAQKIACPVLTGQAIMAEKERFEESTGAVEQSRMINIRHIVYRIINTCMVNNYIVYCSVPSADAVVWVSLWVKIRDYASEYLGNTLHTAAGLRSGSGVFAGTTAAERRCEDKGDAIPHTASLHHFGSAQTVDFHRKNSVKIMKPFFRID